jgi:uncharacterized protein YkwD
MCSKCNRLGTPLKTVAQVPKTAAQVPKTVAPSRDYGWEAVAWLVAPFRNLQFSLGRTHWVRQVLVFVLVTVVPVSLHFYTQARNGHPLDIHYFEAELSPQNWGSVYNGPGGTDWKIGKPLVNASNGYTQRSLIEMQSFALQLVNRDRSINGQPALTLDPLLNAAAQKHAEDMFKWNYFAHNTPEGQTSRDRFLALGGSQYVSTGENIIFTTEQLPINFRVGEKFQKSWMYSNGHRNNLLMPGYSRFGYGIVTDSLRGRAYAVQEFSSTEAQH